MRSGQRPYTEETRMYPDKVLGGNRTDIVFEEININTPGKDGDAIATDFVKGARRKLIAAQAETGMQ